MALIQCPECGKEISGAAEACPNCGYPIKAETQGATNTATWSKRETRKTALIWVLVLAVIVVAGGYFIFGTLHGEDKIAYQLLLDHADSFKDPSSVRLVSGTVKYWNIPIGEFRCCISATNSFGGRETSYYTISKDGKMESVSEYIVSTLSSYSEDYDNKDALNIEKINRFLKRTLSSYD